MKQYNYDKTKLVDDFSETANLGEVFKSIETASLRQGEIVCRFSVNGLALSETEEKKFAKYFVSEVDTLTFETETPSTLMIEVIKNWIDTLPKLITKSDELSQHLRFKGVENKMSAFVDVIDSCQFLIESLISLRSLCQDLKLIQTEKWASSEAMTARAIAEALSSFEKKDFVLLADVLEYDLGNSLQSWLETLQELRKQVEEHGKEPIRNTEDISL